MKDNEIYCIVSGCFFVSLGLIGDIHENEFHWFALSMIGDFLMVSFVFVIGYLAMKCIFDISGWKFLESDNKTTAFQIISFLLIIIIATCFKLRINVFAVVRDFFQ